MGGQGSGRKPDVVKSMAQQEQALVGGLSEWEMPNYFGLQDVKKGDASVVFTTGNQSISGIKNFTDEIQLEGGAGVIKIDNALLTITTDGSTALALNPTAPFIAYGKATTGANATHEFSGDVLIEDDLSISGNTTSDGNALYQGTATFNGNSEFGSNVAIRGESTAMFQVGDTLVPFIYFKVDTQNGDVIMPNLPTSDPSVAGALWNDSGTLKVSSG